MAKTINKDIEIFKTIETARKAYNKIDGPVSLLKEKNGFSYFVDKHATTDKESAYYNWPNLYVIIEEKTGQTIDCTPTWQSLLPVMLEIYFSNRNLMQFSDDKFAKAVSEIEKEFMKIAKAADVVNDLLKIGFNPNEFLGK